MNPEKFCLSWNDFEKNIGIAFRELRESKDFFDVTLVCENEQIQAHKVVISACSPFFRDILRRNPHQQPLVYLRGVKLRDLEAVLSFMYNGEVNVLQEELNSFLVLAEDLQVKGLTQSPSKASPSDQTPRRPLKSTSHGSDPSSEQPLKKSRLSSSSRESAVLPIKSERVSSHAPEEKKNKDNITGTEVSVGDYGDDYEDISDDYPDQIYHSSLSAHLFKASAAAIKGMGVGQRPDLSECFEKLEDAQGLPCYSCLLCGKTCSRKDSLMTHIENIHFPGGYACQLCELTFNSQNTLAVHMRRKHNTSLMSLSSQVAAAAATSAGLLGGDSSGLPWTP